MLRAGSARGGSRRGRHGSRGPAGRQDGAGRPVPGHRRRSGGSHLRGRRYRAGVNALLKPPPNAAPAGNAPPNGDGEPGRAAGAGRVAEVFAGRPLRTERSDARLSPVRVAYRTYGTLNAARDNAVFVCHALTGDARCAGPPDAEHAKPGWWDGFVGPAADAPADAPPGLDTGELFVICANVLGGCGGTTGPGEPHPGAVDGRGGRPWGLRFPFVTVGDLVETHAALVREELGVDRLRAVVGGSLGGMQALEWAVRFPEMCESAVVVASGASLGPQGIAFNAVGRRAILSDPRFRDGNYYDAPGGGPDAGLALARMLAHITYLSEESIDRKFGRRLQDAAEFAPDVRKEVQFQVESYLDYQGRRFTERFDANSLLYLTRAMDHFDLARGRGSLENAFAGTETRFLVLSYTTDWLFPTAASRRVVRALLAAGRDVSFAELDSPYGHDAFLIREELPRLGRIVSGFLGQS